jgi:hypothetical protein
MHFSKFFMTAMVGAASAAPAVIQQRDMSSDDVCVAIGQITDLSAKLTVTVQGINLSPLAVINPATFTPITTGFQKIISTVSDDIQAMATNPIGDLTADTAGQTAICTAFHDFVVVHQNLLAVLIGKNGILTSIGGAPIAAVLRALEKIVDTIAFGIIDAVPFCAKGAQADADSLTKSIETAECMFTPAGPLGLQVTCDVFQTVASIASV